MKPNYRKIDKCLICGNSNLKTILDLGEQYLTGLFPKVVEPQNITKGPLRLIKCHGQDTCGLVQLEHVYDLSEMYGENYGYRSGLNASMVKHLADKVAKICSNTVLQDGDLIVDIGSNDGTTLGLYPEDLCLLGVDPTGGKFRSFYKPHVSLIADFFSAKAVQKAYPNKKAKVVTSFSMFYDLEDPVGFAKEIVSILDDELGIWVFEQSYMPLMLERNAYDTVCHEHLEFYGLKQIKWIADRAGLEILDVELNSVNGGSLSVTAGVKGKTNLSVSKSVQKMLEAEEQAGLSTLTPYLEFSARVDRSRAEFQNFVRQVEKEGKKLLGIGASTKGNVLLQYCGITTAQISKIGDVNVDKHGAFTPGSWIPIQAEDEILASDPDYLLVFPWHFRDFFINHPKFKGRKLVFPLPRLEIVECD